MARIGEVDPNWQALDQARSNLLRLEPVEYFGLRWDWQWFW